MFYHIIPWFYRESENLCVFKSALSSRSDNTGPVTRGYIKSSQMRNETPLPFYRFFLHAGTGIIFLFLIH